MFKLLEKLKEVPKTILVFYALYNTLVAKHI